MQLRQHYRYNITEKLRKISAQYQVSMERIIRIEQKEEIDQLKYEELLQIYLALSETYETINKLLEEEWKKNPFDLYLILQVYEQITGRILQVQRWIREMINELCHN